MPFSSGAYTAPSSTWNPAVAGTTISVSDWNSLLDDLETALSTAILKDGTQTVTANIPMATFKLTGLGAGSSNGDSLRYEQVNGVATTAGDILAATAAGTFTRIGVGSAGTIPMSRTAATGKIAYVGAARMGIAGLVQSQAADTDHDTTISAGGAMDSTNAYWLDLSSAITKQIDASWAVGTNAGGLDGTESVAGTPDANTWYYIWLIARSDTGVVDALYSESASSPTMPTNYDYKRLIGAVKTDGSANITAYDAYELSGGGLEIRWDAPPLDINLSNTLTTSARTDTLSVPTGFSVIATVNCFVSDANADEEVYMSCPDQSDQAPANNASPLFTWVTVAANGSAGSQARMRTSATGTVRSRALVATVNTYNVVTVAFEWARRN